MTSIVNGVRRVGNGVVTDRVLIDDIDSKGIVDASVSTDR